MVRGILPFIAASAASILWAPTLNSALQYCLHPLNAPDVEAGTHALGVPSLPKVPIKNTRKYGN